MVYIQTAEVPESGIMVTSAGSSLVTITALNRWKKSIPARDQPALYLLHLTCTLLLTVKQKHGRHVGNKVLHPPPFTSSQKLVIFSSTTS